MEDVRRNVGAYKTQELEKECMGATCLALT